MFERDDRIGGLLMYGIPPMKLEKNVVDRRVKLMAQEGVNFVTGAWIGKNVPDREAAGGVRRDRAVPAARPRRAICRSRGGTSRASTSPWSSCCKSCKSLLDSNFADRQFIDAKGKNVIVIGGGDTGTDCVGTSLRHGCKSLVQFEILPRPPDTRAADNPWPQWPRIYKLDYGQEEAAALYGGDPRRYVTVTKRLVGDAGRQPQGAAHRRGRLGEERRRPLRHEGEGRAARRCGPPSWCCWRWASSAPRRTACWPIWASSWTRAATSPSTRTRRPACKGVFAAGDMSRGQSLIVWAIEEGRAAARGVDRYLMGETLLP